MRYLLKITYNATDKNELHKGEQDIWYLGKRTSSQKLDWFVKNAAYARKCDATRTLNYRNKLAKWEESAGFWKINCEIIEVE